MVSVSVARLLAGMTTPAASFRVPVNVGVVPSATGSRSTCSIVIASLLWGHDQIGHMRVAEAHVGQLRQPHGHAGELWDPHGEAGQYEPHDVRTSLDQRQ